MSSGYGGGDGGLPGAAPGEGTGVLDLQQIFVSVGEVPYAWQIDSDALLWGGNVAQGLAISDPSAIASGRAYAQLIDPQSSTRADALNRPGSRDDGAGVPYQVQYALRPPGGSPPLWVEDCGRWFAGTD